MSRSRWTQLLEKEMDRKEFLQYLGAVFMIAIGLRGLLNALSELGGEGDRARSQQPQAGNGYGSSAYGGKSRL